MPSRKNRVTRWTNDRGNVLDEFKGAAELNAIEKARKARIPANLLHFAGWNGEEDDVTGYFTDLLYQLVNLPLIGPADMSDAEPLISALSEVCKSVGVDRNEAIDFTMPRFIRSWREHCERLKADGWPDVPDDPTLNLKDWG